MTRGRNPFFDPIDETLCVSTWAVAGVVSRYLYFVLTFVSIVLHQALCVPLHIVSSCLLFYWNIRVPGFPYILMDNLLRTGSSRILSLLRIVHTILVTILVIPSVVLRCTLPSPYLFVSFFFLGHKSRSIRYRIGFILSFLQNLIPCLLSSTGTYDSIP